VKNQVSFDIKYQGILVYNATVPAQRHRDDIFSITLTYPTSMIRVSIPRWIRARDLAKRLKVPNKSILSAVAIKKNKHYIVDLPNSDFPTSPIYVAVDGTTGQTLDQPKDNQLITRFSFPTSKSIILPYMTAERVVQALGRDEHFEDLAPDAIQAKLIDVEMGTNEGETCVKQPIFTILGERDHGKTTLIDRLRNDGKRTKEAGGITQRVRANLIHLPPHDGTTNNISATLLDTPGHSHFFEMREETSYAGDVVILVVAADEGPGPTTWESLESCLNAGVDVVVALNKMDVATKEEEERAILELKKSSYWNMLPSIPKIINISASTGDGINNLLNVMSTTGIRSVDNANKCRSSGYARCSVLDSFVDKGHGLMLRTVVHEGTLKKGDSFVCGLMRGTVKVLVLPNGKTALEGGPGVVCDVVLSKKSTTRKERKMASLPRMGEGLWVMPLSYVDLVLDQRRMEGEVMGYKVKNDDLEEDEVNDGTALEEEEKETKQEEQEEGNIMEKHVILWGDEGNQEKTLLNDDEGPGLIEEYEYDYSPTTVVIKTDSSSSLETILAMLADIPDPIVGDLPLIHVVHAGVGMVTSTDLKMAAVDGSIIYCYNVGLSPTLKKNQIKILQYTLIDELMDSMLSDAQIDHVAIGNNGGDGGGDGRCV
jgi:small GTP-binding protein